MRVALDTLRVITLLHRNEKQFAVLDALLVLTVTDKRLQLVTQHTEGIFVASVVVDVGNALVLQLSFKRRINIDVIIEHVRHSYL